MTKFIINSETYRHGFQEHITINPLSDIVAQLVRKPLYMRARHDIDPGNAREIRQVIDKNSSLRVDFGWSFESTHQLQSMMDECLQNITPNVAFFPDLISDTQCSWIGFQPYNVFERTVYESLAVADLIIFNNEIINFQEEVVRFITTHTLFKQHAILRDERYRFEIFRRVRKDPAALTELFHYYMLAVHDICGLKSIPRDLLEEEIGCHFLYNPDTFFELLNFSILKGNIYE